MYDTNISRMKYFHMNFHIFLLPNYRIGSFVMMLSAMQFAFINDRALHGCFLLPHFMDLKLNLRYTQ